MAQAGKMTAQEEDQRLKYVAGGSSGVSMAQVRGEPAQAPPPGPAGDHANTGNTDKKSS